MLLGGDTVVVDDPLVGAAGKATLAAEVGAVEVKVPGAVDELLLREGDELLVLEIPDSLEGTGGAKGPAGSADTLVLDGGDGSDGGPVDVGGEVVELDLGGDGVGGRGSVVVRTGNVGDDVALELLLGHVSKVVHGNCTSPSFFFFSRL